MGRRSGREYRIPLNTFRTEGGFVFALTYGSDTDWVQNVMAAGGCTVHYLGADFELVRPRFLTTEEGMSHMPRPVRTVLRLIDVTQFLRMDTV